MLRSSPFPAFHLLFQTNMKLLLQIKGENSSLIPYGLTNGGGRAPKSGRQPPPSMHKCAAPPPPCPKGCHGLLWGKVSDLRTPRKGLSAPALARGRWEEGQKVAGTGART